jgi:hypothetical protein
VSDVSGGDWASTAGVSHALRSSANDSRTAAARSGSKNITPCTSPLPRRTWLRIVPRTSSTPADMRVSPVYAWSGAPNVSDAAPALTSRPPPVIGVSKRAATTVVNIVPAAGVENVPPLTV